tara:strand:- start:962 stop:1780 length:819 start_codon:yes stop_codon:yes gene_type:complete
MAKDQDPFSPSADQEIQATVVRANNVASTDLRRGALNHRHIPQYDPLEGPIGQPGVYQKAGWHSTAPGFELYQNGVKTAVHGGKLLPLYDWRLGSSPMRTTGTNAPYGASVNPGWSILAPLNVTADAAEITFPSGINYGSGTPFAVGDMTIEVSGYVEVSMGDDGTQALVPPNTPLYIGIAVQLGTRWFVVPSSIGSWPGNVLGDTMQIRCNVNAAVCNALDPAEVILNKVSLVFAHTSVPDPAPENWATTFQLASARLGCWNLSLDPFTGA